MVLDTELQERIGALSNQRLVDDQPGVEGPSASIAIEPSLRLNYQDRNAFDTHWIEETTAMEKLVCIPPFSNYFHVYFSVYFRKIY